MVDKLDDGFDAEKEAAVFDRNLDEWFDMAYPSSARSPHREICSRCHEVSRVSFAMPNEIWELATHVSERESIICLACFTKLADERMVRWDIDIEFLPTSQVTLLERFTEIEEEHDLTAALDKVGAPAGGDAPDYVAACYANGHVPICYNGAIRAAEFLERANASSGEFRRHIAAYEKYQEERSGTAREAPSTNRDGTTVGVQPAAPPTRDALEGKG